MSRTVTIPVLAEGETVTMRQTTADLVGSDLLHRVRYGPGYSRDAWETLCRVEKLIRWMEDGASSWRDLSPEQCERYQRDALDQATRLVSAAQRYDARYPCPCVECCGK